ncbi:hypothetical protein BV20DRAFT_960662 [Pilatotrama ljubarskyi]|nr:hypothetical protein BV20DRAFT_960662 [Pilatotrama ljubarskyi]
MNRHHPYGGPYDGPRRGGPPGNYGPGPDRSHRYDRGGAPRGRGSGRGRGGGQGSYGGYGNTAPYDQGSPQGDMGGYDNYQSGPPQDPYYQNGSYAAPGPGQYNASDAGGGFDQSFGYEDGSDSNYNQGGGYGRFQKRPQRRERDDKVHDSIIEERIQRERPCRTLFIRNIKYETSSDDVRRLFEEHGEIKTFFDLIANRGMVFVTYYDLRAAERARDRLQGSEISGRPIDVHYSLPRDDNGKGADRQREQELQGTLLVTLRNSSTNQPIDDGEVRRKFQQFGDVKSVRPVGDRPDQRYVEFYDTRACEEAHDRLRHQGLQDGVMEIVFANSGDDTRGASPRRDREERAGFDRQRDYEEPTFRGRRGGRGGRGRGRGFGGDDWSERRDFNHRDRDRARPHEDEFGRAQRGGDFTGTTGHRFGNRSGPGGYGGPGPSGPGYGAPPPPAYGQAAAPAEAADERERLEQAKKVQQLLAALKQPQAAGAPSGAPSAPSAPPAAMPQMPPVPTPPASSYYGQPPMPMPPQVPHYSANPPSAPPANPYASLPTQTSSPQPGQGTTAPLNLPPNLLALLQQGSHGQQQQPTQPGAPPPMPPYSMPPASALIGAQQSHQQPPMPGMLPTNTGQPGYQQLMAYLQSQKR